MEKLGWTLHKKTVPQDAHFAVYDALVELSLPNNVMKEKIDFQDWYRKVSVSCTPRRRHALKMRRTRCLYTVGKLPTFLLIEKLQRFWRQNNVL